MKKLATLLLALSSITTQLQAETMYIDDTLLVPLRSGEGTGFRIVHKGLKSGTQLEIVNKNLETGYSLVRTPSGIEGYLPTRYLSAEPIAKIKLAQAQKQVATLTNQNNTLSTELRTLQSAFKDLEGKHSKASKSLASNTQELSRVKAVSADALNLDQRNRELRKDNEELRNQIELLDVENARLKDKSESSMMMIGGGLVLLGVILALIIPLLKRNKKSDSWA